MIAALRVWIWRHRLMHATNFMLNLERVIDNERQKAKYDVHHCEVELARARKMLIEKRANRNL